MPNKQLTSFSIRKIIANAIQCAAEAEALLANAERVKAITPLCVGLGATCARYVLIQILLSWLLYSFSFLFTNYT
jgi:hypothetical protein